MSLGTTTPPKPTPRVLARRGSAPPPTLKGDSVTVDHDRALDSTRHRSDAFTERFEFKKLIGVGGMGSVSAAEDRGLGRIVAIKQLREGYEHDPELHRRFVLEAQVGAQLEHPNIVPLYSFERTATGAPAFAMQLVEGVTLAEYMKIATEAPRDDRRTGGPYSLKERLGTLLGVCDAIHFAHSRGVVHRDLKPENVMLGRFREVYVMDWGIARLVRGVVGAAKHVVESAGPSDAESLSPAMLVALAPTVHESVGPRAPLGAAVLYAPREPAQPLERDAGVVPRAADEAPPSEDLGTRPGDVVGTPQYMAPEQALGGVERIGPATDQFAIGLMLLELATLRRARSTSSTLQALIEAVEGQSGSREDLEGHAMAPALAAVLARALRKEPADRYPSVEALADDLRSFIRDEPLSVYDEGRARRFVRHAMRRPELAVSVLGAFLLLVAGIVIASLARTAREVEAHARNLDGSRRVLVAVAERAHRIDERLSDIGSNVHAIRAAAVVSLERGAPAGAPLDLTEPALFPSARAGGAGVSFARSVVSWIGKDRGAPAPPAARALSLLEPWLRETLEASLPPAARAGSSDAREGALTRGEAELFRCFVALGDGTFTQLPSRALPAAFDPRASSWYRRGVREPELHWTRPVADMAGRSLRIQAVTGIRSSGKFLGVAGCDLRVSALARELVLDLPGFRRAFLVTKEGKVAVSEELESRVLANEVNAEDDLDLPEVENPVLAAHIRSGDAGGYFEGPGDTLFVYTRLISPAWTYVVELDASRYFVHR